ncbi:MAG: hypothetical protein BYD32DRAFT_403257 [Podila humilis]|nr:MAG: hypothetical protein BYD32DRAFT_403257 [Podila humilis]
MRPPCTTSHKNLPWRLYTLSILRLDVGHWTLSERYKAMGAHMNIEVVFFGTRKNKGALEELSHGDQLALLLFVFIHSCPPEKKWPNSTTKIARREGGMICSQNTMSSAVNFTFAPKGGVCPPCFLSAIALSQGIVITTTAFIVIPRKRSTRLGSERQGTMGRCRCTNEGRSILHPSSISLLRSLSFCPSFLPSSLVQSCLFISNYASPPNVHRLSTRAGFCAVIG